MHTAQVLLTHADLADRQRYLNARSTLHAARLCGVIPVINENDTVVTDEIQFGDNDTLGALVANLIEADLLVILTDQGRLYTADPRRTRPRRSSPTRRGDAALEAWPAAGSAHGSGGMLTKVLAAKRRGAQWRDTASRRARARRAAAPRRRRGARHAAAAAAPPRRAQAWLADHVQLAGVIAGRGRGARAGAGGKSLLPIGVVAVEGEFERGDVVACSTRRARDRPRSGQLLERRDAPDPRPTHRSKVLGFVDEPS